MRGKNKCIILKGGFVEVELDVTWKSMDKWGGLVGDLTWR